MRHRSRAPSTFVVCLLLGTMSCSSSRESPGSEDTVPPTSSAGAQDSAGLAGTTWRLVRFEGGDGTVLTPDDGSKYTLTFDAGGRLAARIDCNRGSATWTSSAPSHLELGPLALTRAMCPPGSLHDQIIRQLPYVRSYVLREGRLFLSLMADGGIYELEPSGSSAPPTGLTLEGTRWRLTHLDGAPVPADAQQTEAHLLFGSTGRRLTGSGGCNHLSGSYAVDGRQLELSRLVTTMMACERGMETERAFLQALELVRAWRIAGRTLELLDESGGTIAKLEGGNISEGSE
jgi:heat shock protein HslJ